MQKNLLYDSPLTAGGNIHIGDITYVVERDFSTSILFLRVDPTNTGYEAMLSIKSPDEKELSLLLQGVQLPDLVDLFNQSVAFQNLRRMTDSTMRRSELGSLPPESQELVLTDALFNAFFPEDSDIGTVCRDFMGWLQQGKISELLLVISTDDEDVQNLPWEMVLPRLGLGNALPKDNFGLIRSQEKTVQSFRRQGPMASIGPLKLLFIPALPEDLPETDKLLEIEAEQRKIIETVRGLEVSSQPKLVMEILDCANLEEIREALTKHRHDIVHISGHGAYVEAVKAGVLYLEDENGNQQQTTGRELGKTLRTFSSIKLLVLSACETAVGGTEGSTAEQLASVGLPAVLAMRFAVTDAGARLFTETLYKRIALGDSLTRAIHCARQRLWDHAAQQRQHQVRILGEWFTPVLYQNQVIGPLLMPGRYDSVSHDRFYPKLDFNRTTHTRLIGEGFIGRKRLLIQMRQYFAQHKAICLHGLGGLGKTTTAEAFAEHYRQRYGFGVQIFRNKAQLTELTILQRLIDKWKSQTQPDAYTAQELQAVVDNPDFNAVAKLQQVINDCLTNRPIILIFDNLEDVQTDEDGTQQQNFVSDDLTAFFRHLLSNVPSTCHVLFTSRYQLIDISNQVTHLPVGKMTYAEEYRYLNSSETLRHLPLAERNIVHRRIDGHPRALYLLEGLLKNDRLFNVTNLDAQIGEVETIIFENLLLDRLLVQLTGEQRDIFLTASVFVGRSPIAALAAVLDVPANEVISTLRILQDWSLCICDVTDHSFEIHTLTRSWLRTQNLPKSIDFKSISYKIAKYFLAKPTVDAGISAMTYFEQAESWDEFTNVTFMLVKTYSLSGYYSTAISLSAKLLAKDISPKTNSDALNLIGMSYKSTGNYSKSLSCLERGLTILIKDDNEKDQGAVLHNIGLVYKDKGDYESALTNLQKSLHLSKKIGDLAGESACLNSISQVYRFYCEYDLALDYLIESLSICRKIDIPEGEGAILNNISQIYDAKGDYEKTLAYLQESLAIKHKIGDLHGVSIGLNNIAQLHRATGHIDQALIYLQESLAIRRQIGDRRGVGIVLNNISQIYEVREQFDKALHYLHESLDVRRSIGDKEGESDTLNNMATIAYRKGDYENALEIMQKSLLISRQIGNKKNEGLCLNNIAQAYRQKEQYKLSLTFFRQGVLIQQEIGDINGMALTYHNMGAIYFEKLIELEDAVVAFWKALYYFNKSGSPLVKETMTYLNIISSKIGQDRFQKIITSVKF